MTERTMMSKEALVEMLSANAFDSMPDNEKDGAYLNSLLETYGEFLDRVRNEYTIWFAKEEYPPRFRQSELREALVQNELTYYCGYISPSETEEKQEHLREKFLRMIPLTTYRDTNFLFGKGIFLTGIED